jgi:peptide/nickel transport system substrate-binding protein
VFSIERARAQTSAVRTSVDIIAAVSAIDDHTIHIRTTAPDSLLWMRLSNVAIMSERWAGTHDVLTPTNVDAGEETFASRHANGTGPFRLEAKRISWRSTRRSDEDGATERTRRTLG